MTTGVFISYRRSDSQATAGRMCDALKRAFGDAAVFRDIDDISAGDDFVQALEKALEACGVLLAIIGPSWLEQLLRRAERDDGSVDHVRREIEAALSRRIDVIPVLVDGASIPDEQQLPPSLQRLGRLQGHAQSDKSWRHDVGMLLQLLESRLGRTAVDPFQRDPPMARQARMAAAALCSPRGLRITAGALVAVALVVGVWRWTEHATLDGSDVAFLLPPEGEGADPLQLVQLFNEMQSMLKLALDSPNIEVVPDTVGPADFTRYRLDRKDALLAYKASHGYARVFIHTKTRVDGPSDTRRLVITPYLRPADRSQRWKTAEGWPNLSFAGPASNKLISIKASFELVEFLVDKRLVRLPPADIQQARLTLLHEYVGVMEMLPAPCAEVRDLSRSLRDSVRAGEIAASAAAMREALATSCGTPTLNADLPDRSAKTASAVYGGALGL